MDEGSISKPHRRMALELRVARPVQCIQAHDLWVGIGRLAGARALGQHALCP